MSHKGFKILVALAALLLVAAVPQKTVVIPPVITVTPATGAPPTQVSVKPTTIRWGNYLWAGAPDAAPKFVEFDLAGRSPLFVDWNRSVATNLVGDYLFKSRRGARQVFWVADQLLKNRQTTFTSSGFPVGFDPGDDQAHQSLTIQKVPGKVYVTSDRNGGSYVVSVKQTPNR